MQVKKVIDTVLVWGQEGQKEVLSGYLFSKMSIPDCMLLMWMWLKLQKLKPFCEVWQLYLGGRDGLYLAPISGYFKNF